MKAATTRRASLRKNATQNVSALEAPPLTIAAAAR